MSNLYILKYNNYYNRIVKKEESLSDYLEFLHYDLLNANFNLNDGINANHIFGSSIDSYDGQGDYLVVTSNSDIIESRWFIIEAMRQRNGQWLLTLRRDLMVDYYNQIIEADTYIEKAILNDDDTLIFNSEALNVNQIKTSQETLKDISGSAWLVGYLSVKQTEDIELEASKPVDYNIAVNDIANWDFYEYSNMAPAGAKKQAYTNLSNYVLNMQVYSRSKLGLLKKDNYTISIGGSGIPRVTETEIPDDKRIYELHYKYKNNVSKSTVRDTLFVNCRTNKEQIQTLVKNQFYTFTYSTFYNDYNGKVIYDNTNQKYYQISISTSGNPTLTYKPIVTSQQDLDIVSYVLGNVTSTDEAAKINYYLTGDNSIGRSRTLTTSTPTAFDLSVQANNLIIELTEVEAANTSISIKKEAQPLKDAPYKMFCMPYNTAGDFSFISGDRTYTMNKDTSMSVMNKIISQLSGSNVLYDAQILPYCPCAYLIDELGQFNLSLLINGQPLTEDINYTLLKDTSNDKVNGFIVYCDYASFSTVINKTIEIDNIKLSNECDKYRLCSPNFNGAFEFNAAKNGGVLGFNVTCTYKPYQSYIKIAPIFGGLYGQSFQDPRGLICGGDFGLALLNDNWATYEINNKNYLNSFNRSIENMEIKNNISRIQDIVGGGVGALGGAAAGATAGSIVAPGIGTVGGAIAGGLASAAGGFADIFINEKLRAETLDYTKDQFNYSLQNIQALPYTLSRVSSLTVDNTIYPIIEYYTCTEREKEAFANKIAFNSMTVMIIGKIRDYINNEWSYNDIMSKGYIKGKIINITNINEDYHIAAAIAEEINKGGFFKWE